MSCSVTVDIAQTLGLASDRHPRIAAHQARSARETMHSGGLATCAFRTDGPQLLVHGQRTDSGMSARSSSPTARAPPCSPGIPDQCTVLKP